MADGAKSGQDKQQNNLKEINRKIFEIRKKIQLSEGQRKAMFEVCETERKQNADQILKLKQEISRLTVAVRDGRSAVVRDRLQNTRLEAVIGPLKDRTAVEARNVLDLNVRDSEKKLNLLKHQVKKKHQYLTKVAIEYQELVSKKLERHLLEKIDIPIKKAKNELENSIHAVEVQKREAEHVKSRYKDIRKTLREDAAHFESNIKKVEEQLQAQNKDIESLQQVMNEATRMRGQARNSLLKEERGATKSGIVREKQTLEGQRLVAERRQELERIERRLFQSGKPAARADNSDAESLACIPEDSSSSGGALPVLRAGSASDLARTFEKLKEATGATSAEEVLSRFQYQRETRQRLEKLRKTLEHEKLRMESKHELLTAELEMNKYAEVKEQKSEEMDIMQKKIDEKHDKMKQFVDTKNQTEQVIQKACGRLHSLSLRCDRKSVPPQDPDELLAKLEDLFGKAISQMEQTTSEEAEEVEGFEDENDDRDLPPSYIGLVRRTPVPTGTSPAPEPPTVVSEDEEEVPSRGFLKRQAQIVVDAKSRRKNVRVMLPQRK